MDNRKIHCPLCNGTGKIFHSNYGAIACLNCEATGIVILDKKQQGIIDAINEQKRIAESEKIKREEELQYQKEETERLHEITRQEEISRKELANQKAQNFNTVISIVIISALCLIAFIIYQNWDAIVNFFIELFKTVMYVLLGLLLGIVILGALMKN